VAHRRLSCRKRNTDKRQAITNRKSDFVMSLIWQLASLHDIVERLLQLAFWSGQRGFGVQ
jgi:hypothetical protein